MEQFPEESWRKWFGHKSNKERTIELEEVAEAEKEEALEDDRNKLLAKDPGPIGVGERE